MAEFWTDTAKYYRLAIAEFLPLLKKLKIKYSSNSSTVKELDDLIEVYEDVAKKIDEYNLNLEDPNRFYDGEPSEVHLKLNDKMTEHFSRLTLRMLHAWQQRFNELKSKDYLTDKNKDEGYRLKNLIWPLEAAFENESMLFHKYKDAGELIFPGEDSEREIETTTSAPAVIKFFPQELIEKLPSDIKKLAEEFNKNYADQNANSCILLLRRILPLSIVRKFQRLDKEAEVLINDDYLDTKQLLGKAEKILKTKRLYQEISNYKLLLDGSQHSYTLNVSITDAEGAAIKVRLFLEDLFY